MSAKYFVAAMGAKEVKIRAKTILRYLGGKKGGACREGTVAGREEAVRAAVQVAREMTAEEQTGVTVVVDAMETVLRDKDGSNGS